MAGSREKLVFVVDGDVKSAEQALRGLDDRIKKVAGSADAAETKLDELGASAKEAGQVAEAAARKQVEAQARANAAYEESAAAQRRAKEIAEQAQVEQKAAAQAARSAARSQLQDSERLVAAEENLRRVREETKGSRSKAAVAARAAAKEEVDAVRAQMQGVERLSRAEKELRRVREETRGKRTKEAAAARKAALQEVTAARAPVQQVEKQRKAAAREALAAARAEAKVRAALSEKAIADARKEAEVKVAASKEAARAAKAAARETLAATAEAERRIKAAEKLVDKLERQADPEFQRDAAFKGLKVARDSDVQERIREVEQMRDAAIRADGVTQQERLRLERAANAEIDRLRARLDDGTNERAMKAAETLGIRRKADIEQEIADVRRSREEMIAGTRRFSGERLAIERATAERIKALNRELAAQTASAFTQRMRSAAQGLRTLGTNVMQGSQYTAPVSLGAGLVVGGAVRGAANVEQNSFRTRALLRQEDEQQLLLLEDLIRNLAKTNRSFSITEIQGAAETLASQNVTAQQMLEGALEATINAAAGGGVSLDDAVKLVTSAANIYKVDARELPKVANMAVGLLDFSRFTPGDAGYSMAQGAMIAKSNSVSLDQYLALTGLLGNAGFESGMDAGTSIKTFWQSQVKETESAKEAMATLGFDPYSADGLIIPVRDLIEALEKAKERLTQEDFNRAVSDLFGSDASRVGTALADQGLEKYDAAMEAVARGDAKASRAIREQGLNAQFKELSNAFTELTLAIADTGLLKSITELTKSLTELVKSAQELSPSMLYWIGIGAAVAAGLTAIGVAAGAVIFAFGALGTVFSGVFGLLGSILSVGGKVIGWLGSFAGWIARAAGGLSGLAGWAARLLTALGGLGGLLARAAAAVAAFVLGIPALPAILIVAGLAAALVLFKDQVIAAVTWVVDKAMAIWDKFWGALTNAKIGDTNLAEITKNAGKQAASSIVPGGALAMGAWNAAREISGFARGIIGIDGPGTGTSDSIPARLSRGESIITARATSFWGRDFMERVQGMDPSAIMRPMPVPVAAGAGQGAGLHPVTLDLGGGGVGGFFGTPDAIDAIERHISRRRRSQYAKPSRSSK